MLNEFSSIENPKLSATYTNHLVTWQGLGCHSKCSLSDYVSEASTSSKLLLSSLRDKGNSQVASHQT